MQITRRQALLAAASAALGAGVTRRSVAAPATKKVLFFTKSSGFQHSVIARKGDELSHAEKILVEIGKAAGFEVVPSKDGRMFDPDKIGQFDAFVFVTTGDLTTPGTDKQPPMSPEGEQAFYAAVKSGKGFVGMHCASDTFGHHRHRGADDPFIQLIGGEFSGHGAQQKATILVSDPAFPGATAFGDKSFQIEDEWYAQKHLANDLHVILTQQTEGMKGNDYQRPNFPQTWARKHGQGRVFYTSMGHREDVWDRKEYQDLIIQGLKWATGQVEANIEPNISTVTPEYDKVAGKGIFTPVEKVLKRAVK
ncbi:ThuA domain-containing protein [Isosphaeraceae bacterium EP7]